MMLTAFAALGLLLSPGAVRAQSMMEHAVAAAGGSAAGVAGKKVSEGFDKLMGKLAETTQEAAGVGDKAKQGRRAPGVPRLPVVRPLDSAAAENAQAGAGRRSQPGPRQAALQVPTLPEPQPGEVPQPAPAARPQPTVADLRAISPGASREAVIERLGTPAGRITLADENGLVEVYSFRSQDAKLGSVKLINGKVAEVRPVE